METQYRSKIQDDVDDEGDDDDEDADEEDDEREEEEEELATFPDVVVVGRVNERSR